MMMIVIHRESIEKRCLLFAYGEFVTPIGCESPFMAVFETNHLVGVAEQSSLNMVRDRRSSALRGKLSRSVKTNNQGIDHQIYGFRDCTHIVKSILRDDPHPCQMSRLGK
jgi:hypothetical protein